MNCRQVEENLSAYLDKALPDEEMDLIKNHLESCPACREEYSALEKTVLMLSELEDIAPPALFRSELRQKLKEKNKKRFSLQGFVPGWLKNVRGYHLMPIAAALIIMLVILPFVGNNKPGLLKNSVSDSDMAMEDSSDTYYMKTKESMKDQVTSSAPEGKGGEMNFMAPTGPAPRASSTNESLGTASVGLTAQPPGEIERKIIKNADVTVQVDDYDITVEAIKNKVFAMNGYVSNESLSGKGTEGTITGYLQIRIPAVHFDEFLSGMDELGKVKGRNIYTQDVTEEYVDVESRLKAMRTKEERLLAILSKSGSLSDILAVENELANTRAQLESLQGRLRYLNNRTDFSAVSINIQQAAASTQQISTGGLNEVLTKTKEAFIKAVNNILLGTGKLVVFFGAALPYLILLAAGGAIAWGYWLKKKKQ